MRRKHRILSGQCSIAELISPFSGFACVLCVRLRVINIIFYDYIILCINTNRSDCDIFQIFWRLCKSMRNRLRKTIGRFNYRSPSFSMVVCIMHHFAGKTSKHCYCYVVVAASDGLQLFHFLQNRRDLSTSSPCLTLQKT